MDKSTLASITAKHLKDIEIFKYAPFPTDKNLTEKNAFNHSNIITKDYFYTVIYPFLNANTGKTFSVIYGDFNKLNYINTNFSEELGDMALTGAFQSFSALLPSDSIITRLGGDEIVFILFDTDQSQAEKYMNLIVESIKNSKTNSYLNEHHSEYEFGITLSVVDSTNGNLESVLKLAEQQVNEAKHIRDQSQVTDQNDIEAALNEKIKIFVKNHIANLRFSEDYDYTLSDLKKEALFLVDLLNDMIDHPEEIPMAPESLHQQFAPEYLHTDPMFLSTAEKLYNGSLTFDSPLEDEFSFAELAQLNYITSEILENLIRDSNSHLLNKSYLKKFLTRYICDSNGKYQAFYCSDIGIKRSNSAYGHMISDHRIQKNARILTKLASDKFNFNNHSFEFSRFDNFIIDQGGGNYLILINSYNPLPEKDFQDIIETINCAPISKDPENMPFPMSYAMCDHISTSDPTTFLNEIRALKKTCNKNKDVFKSNYLSDRDTILSLKKEVAPCIQYYIENVENVSGNFKTRKKFLQNVLTCFLDEISCYDQSARKQLEQKQILSDDEEPEL